MPPPDLGRGNCSSSSRARSRSSKRCRLPVAGGWTAGRGPTAIDTLKELQADQRKGDRPGLSHDNASESSRLSHRAAGRANAGQTVGGAARERGLPLRTEVGRVSRDRVPRSLTAKPADAPYQPGKRAMIKVKHARTADCVVAVSQGPTGLMFWLKRKKFMGSYFFLSATSRAYVCVPYAAWTAVCGSSDMKFT